ncbi:MAG: carbohydrate ABC transporter permease [Candidatus Rokubacteria bacterium]|nr:carbohydrate ABC transporter permease [Candidatus Rokubacteria bacterium]
MTGGRRRRWPLRDLAVFLLLLAYAVPFFWQLLTSFKPEAELLVLPPLLPSRLSWEHYRVVLEQSLMLRALGNSLGVATLTTLLALALGLPAAYAFARFPVPGKGLLLLAIIAGTAFPQIATVSPLYLLMRALELRDTWLALILANASFALPLIIWLLTGFVRELPEELEHAAEVDGASRAQVVRFIVLPLVAPGLASAALLTFLFSWNEFLFAYTFTATEASRTVPVALALFPGVFEVPWGDIAAASMLASLPPIALLVGLQRYLIRGLLAGALRE